MLGLKLLTRLAPAPTTTPPEVFEQLDRETTERVEAVAEAKRKHGFLRHALLSIEATNHFGPDVETAIVTGRRRNR